MHIRGLDVLRGLAIGLVILRHAWPGLFGSAGIVGVVTFFTLSGYLITGLLMRDVERRGRVDYRRFYRNRLLRLVPALIFFLLGVLLVTLWWDPTAQRASLWRSILIGLTYTANLPIDVGNDAITHLWTLATEEQFYLVWPFILTLGIRRHSLRRWVFASAGLIVVAMIVCLLVLSPNLERMYSLPTSWALAMVIGAAARIWSQRVERVLPSTVRWRAGIGLASLVGLIALSFVPDAKDSPYSYLLLGPLVALISVALITIWSDWVSLPTRALLPLVWLGKISYAAYLWNYAIAVWLHAAVDEWWVPLGGVISTIVMATVSWWAIEKPISQWRRRLDRRNTMAVPRSRSEGRAPRVF
ncbi:acyltransferase family protein [Microbacterium sp. NPDC091382]|uniref:acyltransferase family protein n=1 Tax=Microbacterium sp. NPDC091382 TaxID=3364210 RepID=UPI00382CE90C